MSCPWVQVLGGVLNCLHRAQLGSAATAGLDPQLPQLVRLPLAASSPTLPTLAPPQDPTARQHPAASMAQEIFGQKVQVSGHGALLCGVTSHRLESLGMMWSITELGAWLTCGMACVFVGHMSSNVESGSLM